MDIAELLAFSVKNKASDLHLSAGLPPMIRVDGDVRRINISRAGTQAGAFADLRHHVGQAAPRLRRILRDRLLVRDSRAWRAFRVNAFNQNRGAGAVFRTIPSEVLTLEDLGCPRSSRS
jgi:twitching motility protein PilT